MQCAPYCEETGRERCETRQAHDCSRQGGRACFAYPQRQDLFGGCRAGQAGAGARCAAESFRDITTPTFCKASCAAAQNDSFASGPYTGRCCGNKERYESYDQHKASCDQKDPKLANAWKTKSVEELTDADVLAMSDDDYMNDAQLAFFRRKLVTLKNDMHVNAGETAENLREDTVVVPDPADRATIEEEHALELRTRDRERKLLKKIDQSIARIDAGDYGYCDETGEPIGVGRLLARPTATLSLEAQQRRELKQKMYGD